MKKTTSEVAKTVAKQQDIQARQNAADKKPKKAKPDQPAPGPGRKSPAAPMSRQHLSKPGKEAQMQQQHQYDARAYQGSGKLKGMTALITGGAGEGFRVRLAQRGIEVVITGEADPLQAVIDYTQGVVKPAAPHDHDHHCD